jgi:hypothetical protein
MRVQKVRADEALAQVWLRPPHISIRDGDRVHLGGRLAIPACPINPLRMAYRVAILVGCPNALQR